MNAERCKFARLVELAATLCVPGKRHLLGITGAPGAGKSVLASRLVDALEGKAVLVPMDGYHLSNRVLINKGMREIKGRKETFDVDGYLEVLKRISNQTCNSAPIYVPAFHREIEESISAEIEVLPTVPLVISEGNYLLARDSRWTEVSELFSEIWYLDIDYEVRLERLIHRHMKYGKSLHEARRWSLGSDQDNAHLIESTQQYATRIIRLDE